MGYSFRRRESVSTAIRRIAREQLEAAVDELSGDSLGHDDAIHQARKRIKKTRAVLRLAREDLGGTYKDENRTLRDVGRELSHARDAVVLVETFDSLTSLLDGDAHDPDAMRSWLVARRDRVTDDASAGSGIEHATKALREAAGRVEEWPVANGFGTMKTGLNRIYAAGRDAMDEAWHEGSLEAFHEWRKRAKDLWYVSRMLKKTARRPMSALRKDIEELTDALGTLHDLDVFADTMANEPELAASPAAGAIADAMAKERARLADVAFALGARIYAEKPKAFVRRMTAYWNAWRHGIKAKATAAR